MRRGLSLLEVVLALAILGVSLAVIGELIRLGTRAGEAARDDLEAQLICESIVNEIAAGATMPETLVDAPVDQLGEWLCSVESQAVDDAGLMAVRVTVRRANASPSSVPPYTLTRWIIDPSVELAAREAEKAMEEQLALRNAAQASGTAATEDAASGAGQSDPPDSTGGQPMPPPGGEALKLPRDGKLPPDLKLPDGLKLPEGFDPNQFTPGQFNPGGRGGRGGGGGGRGGRGGGGGPSGR